MKFIFFILVTVGMFSCAKSPRTAKAPTIVRGHVMGDKLDSLNGVYVYYNGGTDNVIKHNVTPTGYCLGLQYQSAEFVKRYYYEFYHHEMPNPFGDPVKFYDWSLRDGGLNKKRDLIQYSNPSYSRPQVGDILILGPNNKNESGHAGIISKASDTEIEIIQQNAGPAEPTRIVLPVTKLDYRFKIGGAPVLGRLRKDASSQLASTR